MRSTQHASKGEEAVERCPQVTGENWQRLDSYLTPARVSPPRLRQSYKRNAFSEDGADARVAQP